MASKKQISEVKIHVEGLTKDFGENHVLRGIDIDIHAGEVVCVIGPSGSGKSTFLRCINRLEEATSGEILIDGQSITGPKANVDKIRQHVAWCSSSSTSSRTTACARTSCMPRWSSSS